ncbi:PIN domain-containing protein [Cellulomonas fimi]|uniref:Type II toxin-antitoxin system VapC family toxin n=1 Tax=Cellulomonas fimi TaxID=1708 RepID=A0A7Y0M146_CELFI|nr:PIN domain-containing protein [Cellulomonas fimi]NMR21133.1 type II toxin-antitoxin system VapC family toxin [Cellulomonas fimi]
MLVYVDGSALSRYLLDLPGSREWRAWAEAFEPSFVTTPLGLTELSRVAQGLDAGGRTRAHEVGERLTVVRFSDQTLAAAATAPGSLSPFAALHLGTAVAHPDITMLATYDALLAREADTYGLAIVSPGYPEGWWFRRRPTDAASPPGAG